MNKMLKLFFLVLVIVLLLIMADFLARRALRKEKITWGVNFSQMRAESLGLNWKKTYLAVLDDLGAKNIKMLIQWDFVEGKKGEYFFNDIDWQVKEAEKRKAKLIFVVGMKTGRWPECHLPDWAKNLPKEEQQRELLKYVEKVVIRYKNSEAIAMWQAENEPFLRFGECPWYDRKFVKKEVELIKSIDSSRQVIVSDSGEYSLWVMAAATGDIAGTTMYKKVWVHITDKYGFYMPLWFPASIYGLKAKIIEKAFGKKVINIELQAEPWVKDVYADISLKEQEKTMDIEQFKKNIAFAKESGLDTFYFWGTEWWYWLKEKQNKPEIWNEARKLF